MEHSPRNELDRARSPYLRQHKDNPVHWQPWGPAAFDRARQENKPVLLSIGYAACHWCHVMAHESFENPAVARLLNAAFVCIKLDREERPDLDQLYQHALALMGRQGGWPLTIFLDADGRPFWGGTYFPPLPRHGLPGFADVLMGVAQSYAHEKDAVAHNINALSQALRDQLSPPPAPAITPEIIARAAAHIRSDLDPVNGGLGDAPKFPQLTRLRLVWDAALRENDRVAEDAVVTALAAMCQGGLYDHLGGGFFRYCVDDAWTTPHFEKMIDDQAMFIHLLADVLSRRPHPLLSEALEATVAFTLRAMLDADSGLFISSLDADSDAAEGGHYLWQVDAIDQLLGDHAALFHRAYRLHDGHIQRTALLGDADEEILQRCRKKLLYARQERALPARDDKIMTDANARMIAALATAGSRLDRTEWIDAAQKIFATLDTAAETPPRHVWNDPDSVPLADDTVSLAWAALMLAQVLWWEDHTFYIARARDLMESAVQRFMDADGRLTARGPAETDSFIAVPPVADTPTPAAAATALRALVMLAYASAPGDLRWHGHAARLSTALAAPLRDNIAMMAASLCAMQFYQNPLLLHADAGWRDYARRYVPDALWMHDRTPGLSVCLATSCQSRVADEKDADAALARALRQSLHKPANH